MWSLYAILTDMRINLKEHSLGGLLDSSNAGASDCTAEVDSLLLWLYSATELCGKVNWWSGYYSYYNDIINSEGNEYKLYRDMNVNSTGSNSILVKRFDNESCLWWGAFAGP